MQYWVLAWNSKAKRKCAKNIILFINYFYKQQLATVVYHSPVMVFSSKKFKDLFENCFFKIMFAYFWVLFRSISVTAKLREEQWGKLRNPEKVLGLSKWKWETLKVDSKVWSWCSFSHILPFLSVLQVCFHKWSTYKNCPLGVAAYFVCFSSMAGKGFDLYFP